MNRRITSRAVTSTKLLSAKFGYKSIQNNSKLVNLYTGLPNKLFFEWYLSLFEDTLTINKVSKLCKEDCLLLVLMKLRLGLLNADLAMRFDISSTTVSRLLRTSIFKIAAVVKNLIVWPERNIARRNLPDSFKKKFLSCIVTIDCTEIFIEQALGLDTRAKTWSNYKHHHTAKYLIGITPGGSISFLSSGWGGRVSDKEITLESGFLDKLQYGDSVLADRGFTVEEELATRGAILKMPKFLRGKSQMAARDVDLSRQIAHVRIHVERVIGRMRKFHILQSIIPVTQVDMLDEIMVIIASIVNINHSVVPLNS